MPLLPKVYGGCKCYFENHVGQDISLLKNKKINIFDLRLPFNLFASCGPFKGLIRPFLSMQYKRFHRDPE